ncbi:hypothetical protein ACJ41O_005457 [Fusarium nematophilum]
MNESHRQHVQNQLGMDLVGRSPQPRGSDQAPGGSSLLYRLLLATQWDEEDINLWQRFTIRRSSVARCVEGYLRTFDRIRNATGDPDDDDDDDDDGAPSSPEGESLHGSTTSVPSSRPDPARPVEKDLKLLKAICDDAFSDLRQMDDIIDEARALLKLERRGFSPTGALWTLFPLVLFVAAPNGAVAHISIIWLGSGIVNLVVPPACSALLFYRIDRLQGRVRELKRRFAERAIDESNRHDLDRQRCLFLREALYSVPQGRVREV